MAANRPRPADVKEPITLLDNGGCCQVKRKSANTPEISQAGIKVPRRGHRHCSSDGYGCRKSPDRLTTVGGWLAPLSHPVTLVAVLTEVVLRCAPPLMVMVPVIGAAVGVAVV